MPAVRLAALCAVGVLAFATACGAGEDLRGAMERASAPTAAVAAPATDVPPSADPQADDDGPAPSCTGPGLAVSLDAPRSSGDTVRQDLIFQNVGTAPCVMRGFPSVVAVAGNEGVPVGEPALPVDGRGPQVRLEPRAAATVPLRVVDADAYDATTCRARTVRGLRVVPAGGTGPVFVPRVDRLCSAGPLPQPQMTVRTTVAR